MCLFRKILFFFFFFWDISSWLFFINLSRKQTQQCRLWLQIWEKGLDSLLKVGECFLKNWGWYHFGVTDECGVPGVLLKNVDKESRAEGVLSTLEFFLSFLGNMRSFGALVSLCRVQGSRVKKKKTWCLSQAAFTVMQTNVWHVCMCAWLWWIFGAFVLCWDWPCVVQQPRSVFSPFIQTYSLCHGCHAVRWQ